MQMGGHLLLSHRIRVSYTTFAYLGLKVENQGDAVTVSFDITNKRKGE